MIFFILIIIFGISYINMEETKYNKIYEKIEGNREITAVVISEPENREYKYRYTIKVESVDGDTSLKGIKLILDVKNSITYDMPSFGDKVIINGDIEVPNTSRNYKGYDYRQYLKTKKIYGTIDAISINKINSNCLNYIDNFVNYIQNNMKETFNSILDDDESSLCIGILIGDRTNISDEIEDDFKESNLTHMLAVSGSHISYIINGFAIILAKTNKKFSKIITIIFLLFFIVLTGYTSSVIRAGIMGILVLISSLIYRKSNSINNLGIASFIILLINPYIIYDIGFVLSFAGTLGIILLSDKIATKINNILKLKDHTNLQKKIIKYLILSFSITLSANVLIIPIMAYNFSTFSLTFWISNILAGPVMEIVTVFSFLIYLISIIFFPLAKFLGVFLNILLSVLLKIAEISSVIPGSMIYIKTPYLATCILFYTALILLIYEKGKIKKKVIYLLNKKIVIIFILIIFVFTTIYINAIPSSLKVYFIDIGQGDSTLIQTPCGKNILIDGGGSEISSFNVGENTLLPYLLDRRVKKLDYVIISHFDSDHVQGILYVMQYLKVKNIIISKQGEVSDNLIEFQDIIADKKINIIIVKQGDYINVDRVTHIEIIFPEEELITDNVLNNNSIVCKFVSNDFSMLFTGDIEKVAENKIYEKYKDSNILNSDVLKIAHHGSQTSSTEEFLSLVNPKIALIGVGENNNYGHPNLEVLQRIKKYTDIILRTDECGEIILEYTKNRIKIKKHLE